MPRKVALLIGVSEYGAEIPNLSAPQNDVAAMKRILSDRHLGGFDSVETLINPNLVRMQQAIKKLFADCGRDDLALLFFSGHGITDDDDHLYLGTNITAKHDFDATAVPALFVQKQLNNSYCRRQVIILDCCYSGAFANGWHTKSVCLDIRQELGAEGTVVLTSSSSTQTSFEQQGTTLSLYTQYLVEGIEKGAADTNQDGKIYIQELHNYAKAKVQAVKPKMKPEIILDQEGYNILLAQVSQNPQTEYRRQVEESVKAGTLSELALLILKPKRRQLGLTDDEAEQIEAEVLEPFRRRQQNLEKYRQVLLKEVEKQYPFDDHTQKLLKTYQQDILGLRDEDVAAIWQEIGASFNPPQTGTPKTDNLTLKSAKTLEKTTTAPKQQNPQLQASTEFRSQEPSNSAQKSIPLPEQPSTQTPRPPISPVSKSQQPHSGLNVSRNLTRRRLIQLVSYTGAGLGTTALIRVGSKLFKDESSLPSDNLPSECEQGKFSFNVVTLDQYGKIENTTPKTGECYIENLGNNVTLEMVSIPAGELLMGSPKREKGSNDSERPQHRVRVDSFFMGKYPVTQAQWQAVASLPKLHQDLYPDPSKFKGENRPVEQVSWYSAIEFCARLSKNTGKSYVLPSEAQWEYACRAGTTTPFHFGETISTDVANYNGNQTYGSGSKGVYRQETTPVGNFKVANNFGLFDMHGNVWEWCAEPWHKNYENAPTDGHVWDESVDDNRYNDYIDNLVNIMNLTSSAGLRGGSWLDDPTFCRSAIRLNLWRDIRDINNGFRVVCVAGRTFQ